MSPIVTALTLQIIIIINTVWSSFGYSRLNKWAGIMANSDTWNIFSIKIDRVVNNVNGISYSWEDYMAYHAVLLFLISILLCPSAPFTSNNLQEHFMPIFLFRVQGSKYLVDLGDFVLFVELWLQVVHKHKSNPEKESQKIFRPALIGRKTAIKRGKQYTFPVCPTHSPGLMIPGSKIWRFHLSNLQGESLFSVNLSNYPFHKLK